MKILENTAQRLVLRRAPYSDFVVGVLSMLLGLIPVYMTTAWFAVVSTCMFIGFGGYLVLQAKMILIEMHAEGVLRIRKKGIFENSQKKYMLDDVEDIYMASFRDTDGIYSYRITFLIAGNKIPLTRLYSSGLGDTQSMAVAAMKKFLSHYQQKNKTVSKSDDFLSD